MPPPFGIKRNKNSRIKMHVEKQPHPVHLADVCCKRANAYFYHNVPQPSKVKRKVDYTINWPEIKIFIRGFYYPYQKLLEVQKPFLEKVSGRRRQKLTVDFGTSPVEIFLDLC